MGGDQTLSILSQRWKDAFDIPVHTGCAMIYWYIMIIDNCYNICSVCTKLNEFWLWLWLEKHLKCLFGGHIIKK